jgi:predicted enzyme related to lactoylglutathione lyase
MAITEAINDEGVAVLSKNRISAVLCSTDLDRSREFYEQRVGLTLSPETVPNHLLFEAGDGTTLLVYKRPSPNLADHTQVRFWCADVASDARELVGRGVQFDLVEFGDFKMVDHVLTTPVGSSAWFKDPDGNTIALFQPA